MARKNRGGAEKLLVAAARLSLEVMSPVCDYMYSSSYAECPKMVAISARNQFHPSWKSNILLLSSLITHAPEARWHAQEKADHEMPGHLRASVGSFDYIHSPLLK